MDTATAAPAQSAAQGFNIEVPRPVNQSERYIFTVADMIDDAFKADNTDWKRGGVIHDVMTLKWCHGYVPRCEIREMRQHMEGDNPVTVQPEQRQHKVAGYIANTPNAQTGELESKVIGKLPDGEPDGLLRTPLYPAADIAILIGANDGLVEMPVASFEDKRKAQLFLFPDWPRIESGDAVLPPRTSQLRAWFMKRLSEAQKLHDANPAAGRFYSAVCLAAIRSCDNFTTWGNAVVRAQNARYDQAQQKGWAWTYGMDAIKCFEQLGLQRKDQIAQESADKMDKLTDAMTIQAENQAKLIDLELARARNAAPSAIPTPAVAPPVETTTESPESSVVTEPEAETCLATTASGTRCKNKPGDDGFCSNPAHNAETEAAKGEAT